jgi:hypothetical protein
MDPAEATICFQIRTSVDPTDMGALSENVSSPGTLSCPLPRPVQYKVRLSSNEPGASPTLRAVMLSWSGLESDAAEHRACGYMLHAFTPNPARDGATIAPAVRKGCHARLRLFDAAGR